MDNELKRRTFLTVMIGTLLGVPVAYRLLGGGKHGREVHHFTKELNRLQTLVRVPVTTTDGPSAFSLALKPPVGRNWNYVVFAPSFLPENVSHALHGEPDMFLVKEGKLSVHQTRAGQIVLTGRDTNFSICSPIHTEERPKNEIILRTQNGVLYPAVPKGESSVHSDHQFLHLLPLAGVPQELAVGKKWKSNTGRVKPFERCPTEYAVAGFAEVAGRKTVNIRFKGSIPNIARLPGVNSQKPDKDANMTNEHEGNAYFDLETGLLIRQEVEMVSVCRGNEFPDKNGLTIKAQFSIQLFHA